MGIEAEPQTGPRTPHPMQTAPSSTLDAPRLSKCAASFLAGRVGGQGQTKSGGKAAPSYFFAMVVTDTNQSVRLHYQLMMKSTRAPSSSRRVQWDPSEMPGLATQANRGPRSRGSDHCSKSEHAGVEKRAGERNQTSRSDSTMEATQHNIMHLQQAGICGLASGPTHPRPSLCTNLHKATTSPMWMCCTGPTMASGPSPQLRLQRTLPHHPNPHTTHYPGWHQPIPARHPTPPTTPPITHQPIPARHPTPPTPPPITHQPIPTRHPTPPTTPPITNQPIPARHPTPPTPPPITN